MRQLSFATLDHQNKKKRTKRERFLAEMDVVVPWGALALNETNISSRWHRASTQGRVFLSLRA